MMFYNDLSSKILKVLLAFNVTSHKAKDIFFVEDKDDVRWHLNCLKKTYPVEVCVKFLCQKTTFKNNNNNGTKIENMQNVTNILLLKWLCNYFFRRRMLQRLNLKLLFVMSRLKGNGTDTIKNQNTLNSDSSKFNDTKICDVVLLLDKSL